MRTRRSEAIWIDARNRWQINVQRDGVRKTFTDSTPGRQGKHSAEQKADRWLQRFSTEQKLGEAWTMFVEDKREQVTENSANNLENKFKIVSEVIPQSKRLSAISIYEWQKVLDYMASNNYAVSTIRVMQTIIGTFNNYCLRRRWECEEIRTGDLTVPKTGRKTRERRAYTNDELKKLYALDETDSPYIYLFQLLPLTGLRISEARALKWQDISDHVLHLRRAVSASGKITDGKTENAKRDIPLIAQAESILDDQKAMLAHWQIDGEYIFPDVTTGKLADISVVENAWKKLRKVVGTECSIHEMRHTFISMSKAELPLSLLKQVAGHSVSMDTLKVYGHQTEKDLETSRRLLGSAFETVY